MGWSFAKMTPRVSALFELLYNYLSLVEKLFKCDDKTTKAYNILNNQANDQREQHKRNTI
jgi:hypothetical protein